MRSYDWEPCIYTASVRSRRISKRLFSILARQHRRITASAGNGRLTAIIGAMVTQQNIQKALQFYHKAAQKSSGHSQYMLGYIYGDDVTPPDFKKAARWFKEAARQGHSDAQLKLGFYYHQGRGVRQDYKMAFKLFTQAAAQGHATAMHNSATPMKTGMAWKKMKNRRLPGIASLRSWVISGGCLLPADCFFTASAHRQIRKKVDAGQTKPLKPDCRRPSHGDHKRCQT